MTGSANARKNISVIRLISESGSSYGKSAKPSGSSPPKRSGGPGSPTQLNPTIERRILFPWRSRPPCNGSGTSAPYQRAALIPNCGAPITWSQKARRRFRSMRLFIWVSFPNLSLSHYWAGSPIAIRWPKHKKLERRLAVAKEREGRSQLVAQTIRTYLDSAQRIDLAELQCRIREALLLSGVPQA